MQKILIVDDDEMSLSMAEFALKKEFTVNKAKSGEECIKCIQSEKYDLILLDVEMPQMDGIETLTKVRETMDNEHKDVKVAFMTATVDDRIHQAVEALSVVGIINKPFIPKILLSDIEQMI